MIEDLFAENQENHCKERPGVLTNAPHRESGRIAQNVRGNKTTTLTNLLDYRLLRKIRTLPIKIQSSPYLQRSGETGKMKFMIGNPGDFVPGRVRQLPFKKRYRGQEGLATWSCRAPSHPFMVRHRPNSLSPKHRSRLHKLLDLHFSKVVLLFGAGDSDLFT